MDTHDVPAMLVNHWGSNDGWCDGSDIRKVKPVRRDIDPSRIGENLVNSLTHKSRIKNPSVRETWLNGGPRKTMRRGGDAFVEVDWETAIDLAARELERVRTRHGNEAIYGGSYGWGSAGRFHHAQSQVHRFLNAIGGYTRSLNTYSHAAEEVVLPHIVGTREGFLSAVPRWEQIAEHTDVFISFGGLPVRSTQVTPGGIGSHENRMWQIECARRGVEFIVVSPYKDDDPEIKAKWIPIRPNTDTALMLALTHWLIQSNQADLDFVQRCCVGGEHVRKYLFGEIDGVVKDAQWAAEICDIAEETITWLASRMVNRRSLVNVTWSLQRQHHGEMNYWAAFTLGAFAGSMGFPGGGTGTGYSSMHNAHLFRRVSAAGALPQLTSPVDNYIPVARVADMLLNPGHEYEYNGSTLRYPDIRLVYWIGGNPFHHHQDLNRLLRAWEKPETIIVHETHWTATAKRADIVFPVAMSAERNDFAIGMGDPWLQWMSQVNLENRKVKTDYEVFSDIAQQLGAHRIFTENRSSTEWIEHLYEMTKEKCAEMDLHIPELKKLQEMGSFRLPLDGQDEIVFSALRDDPDESPLETPSGKIELYSNTVASFDYKDCPGFAAWLEPQEWLGSPLTSTFPLHLVSHQPTRRLHSQLDFGHYSVEGKINGRETVAMSVLDAEDRGLINGDTVRVFNDRGACLAGVRIVTSLKEGVISLPTGAWFDPEEPDKERSLDKSGNPNVLTLDIGTSSLAQGPSSHTCLVQVEKYEGEIAELSAFMPPRFVDPEGHERTSEGRVPKKR